MHSFHKEGVVHGGKDRSYLLAENTGNCGILCIPLDNESRRLSYFSPEQLRQMKGNWILSQKLAHLSALQLWMRRVLSQPSKQKGTQDNSLAFSTKTLSFGKFQLNQFVII